MRWAVLLIVVVVLSSVSLAADEYFVHPDIKDDFCGVHINFQFCRCAYHNEYCKQVNMDDIDAGAHVYSEYEEWVKTRIDAFAKNCIDNGGIYQPMRNKCTYCEEGEVREKGLCKDPQDTRSIKDQYRLPDVDPVTGGSINPVGYFDSAEGEVFMYSQGHGKWIGPVRRGRAIFEGDVILTTIDGRAQIRFGSSNFIVTERTQMQIPTPQRKKGLLERGLIAIWDNIKRLATNQPFEVEGGHSISGRKGTTYIVSVEDDVDTYTVKEGVVEVWMRGDETTKRDVNAGESVTVSESGVASAPYDWDSLLDENGLTEDDFVDPTEPENIGTLDPDAVDPTELAYSGDIYYNIPSAPRSGSMLQWLVLVAVVIAGGYFFWKKKMKKR